MNWVERVGRRLRPRDLHVFLAVAEHRTMAKAAQELGVSRPVVSRSISDLEHLLGVPLFDRMLQGLVPTPYGEALLQRSFAVLDDLRQSVLEIENLKNPDQGELRFATSDVFAAALVPTAMDRLSRRYPDLNFTLDFTTPSGMATYLRERRGELVITRVLPDLPPGISAEPLYFERLRVVAHVDSPWHKRRRLSLLDLLQETWVLSEFEMGEDSPFIRTLRSLGGVPPERMILSNSLTFRIGLLAADRYVTLMPGSILELVPQWRRLVAPIPIVLPDWHLPAAILTLKGRNLSASANAFAEEMRAVCSPNSGLKLRQPP